MDEYLSTYSVISLYHYFQQQKYYLVTKSLIKNKTFLSAQSTLRQFQNALFILQIEGNNMEFKVAIQYGQPVYLRHKISNKYLSLAMEQLQEKEIRYRLVLSTQKKYFTIKPCYQYQTKISTKIKFDEEIYLSTQFTESRQGMIVAQKIDGEMQMFLEFNVKSKMQFHRYSVYQKEEKHYKHGKIVWLSHIQSDNFLSIVNVNGKEEVAFQPIKLQKQIQSLSALWTVEANDLSQSNQIKYDQEIRFKNLISGHYLSFSKNYKLVDNQRIYQIFLEENRGEHSKFMFKSIKQSEKKEISLNSYLFLFHCESSLFLGCRNEKLMPDCFKLLTFSYMEDEDLFKLNTFNAEEEQALRFVFAIRADFKEIQKVTKKPVKQLTLVQILQIEETYINIKRQFQNLKKYEKLYQFVRNELGSSISLIAGNLQFFRNLMNTEQLGSSIARGQKLKQYSVRILKLAYEILCIFCKDHNQNQNISFQFLKKYIADIGIGVGAQGAVIETFRNNKILLPKVGSSASKEGNLIRIILEQFMKKNPEKNPRYWTNLQKIIQILNIVIFYRNLSLDINQFLISQQLFENGYYETIFLPIQIHGSRIVILDHQLSKFVPIQSIQKKQLSEVVQSILLLFSNLTSNHSFISKVYINNYFTEKNQACLSIMIDYLNKPIKKSLYNQILNFISKTYVDSSPRLRRIKPLSFIFFQFQQAKTFAEVEESFMSQRLRQMMILKAQESLVCKPLHYSNLLPVSNSSAEPSMSQQQLVIFRLNLTEMLLSSRQISQQQLQTICLLMKLQCYTVNEMLQIYQQLKKKLCQGNLKFKLLPKILSIINQLYLLILELQTKKLTLYLKYTFNQKKDLTQQYYKYLLPLSIRFSIPIMHVNSAQKKDGRVMVSEQAQVSQKIIKDYNQLRDTLALMHAGVQLKQVLIKYFCEFKENLLPSSQKVIFLQSFFNLILKTFLPKNQFLVLLSKSTILTHEQVDQFQQLFNVTKKLQYLILISDYWMVSDNDPENCKNFLKYLYELTNFLYEDSSASGLQSEGKLPEESIKKQLFMSSLGVHRLILQLLEKNSYLVASIELKKDLSKKYKQIFQACFLFLLRFIRKCGENKQVLYEYFPILMLYQNTIQLGQLALYTQFYRDQKNFIKQINFSFVEKTIMKIIKTKSQNSKNQHCDYNPEYIDLIITMIQTLNEESKFFIEQLYNYILKPDIFYKLLFIQENKATQQKDLCLKMHRIKMEPLQLPILYHSKLLELFNIMLSNATQTIRNAFKLKLLQTFKINYFFNVLSSPDIFSNTGIQSQLNFIIKKQIFPILLIYLDKSQFIGQIYQSDELIQLLQFISRCFSNGKPMRPEITNESQSFFIPFLQALGGDLFDYEKNKEIYLFSNIKPLLAKLTKIFQKQSQNKIKNYLQVLQATINDQYKSKFIKATTLVSNSLSDVKLKWRNFVDDDEDNSKEEKYVKKSILDILKSKTAAKIIQQQLVGFYKIINKNSTNFIGSMLNLLKILFQSKQILQGRKEEAKTAVKVLNYLSGYIQFYSKDQKQQQTAKQIAKIIKTLEQCKFIDIFIELTNNKQFELRKIHLKNIFVYCLKILNFLLQYDKELKFSKLLLKIFKDQPQTYKFLEFLQIGARQIIGTIDPHNHLEQINSALIEMKLCIDKQPQHLYEQTYRTLTYLCKFEPFTQYLRNQQSPFVDIDFLEKIYNVLNFLFSHHNDQNHLSKLITVSNVRAAQQILDFVASMLTGANKSNQNYIIDNKFTHFVQNVLKLQDIQPNVYEFQVVRQELLNKIIEFYQSNGIDIEQLLKSKIRLIDFRHIYLLNRFKVVLVKTLLQCLIANDNAVAKMKMDISVEIIKFNLILVYEAYKKGKYNYLEEIILNQRTNWINLVDKDFKIEPLFLKLGFYYFQLIEVFQEKEAEADNIENYEKIVNEEKEKERIVKKFFKIIKENTREPQREKFLQTESLRQQMKYYYHTYYNALIFFKKKSGTIQVDLKGQILKVYFPKVPFTEKITKKMEQQFQIGVSRISREQKIKSLIQYQNTFYQDIKGEQDYFNQIQRGMPFLGPILRVMKYEDQFLLAALISSFLICIQYLLSNYIESDKNFSNGFFQYINIGKGTLSIIMLLLSVFNLLIGVFIAIYLFTRKIPLRKKLLSLKFKEIQRKEKDKTDAPKSQTFYVWSNILMQSIYNLYIIVFLILTMFHPFFSAFPLVDIITRIQMGRFIIRSMKETWVQLFVAIGMLIVFNILVVQIIYDFFTSAPGYGTMCKSQYTCMLFLTDQILKGGSGAVGNVEFTKQRNVVTIQLLFEISYILIGCKVITEIFSGTIIDKFSQLREEEENIAEDQNTICYICALQRFDLDLEYEGFTTHIEQNHQTFNYIKYLFYLRRQRPREYGIVQRYISEQKLKDSEKWIPEGNSLFKQTKQRKQKEEEEQQDVKEKVLFFCKQKMRDMKRIKQRVENMNKDLKRQAKPSLVN